MNAIRKPQRAEEPSTLTRWFTGVALALLGLTSVIIGMTLLRTERAEWPYVFIVAGVMIAFVGGFYARRQGRI